MSADDSAKREAAALALARGLTFAGAALEVGVSERTLYRWREDKTFSGRIHQIRADLFAQAAGKLSQLAGKAAERLGELVDSDNPAVALGACRTVLEAGLRLREALDLEERLTALESHLSNLEGEPCL
jgi:transposase-like protein